MYVRSKQSPKKPGPSKVKESANSSSSSSKQKDLKYAECNQSIEDKEIVLPVLKAVDPEKYLQTYSAVLRRPKEEGVGIEDLDRLQVELEMVLSNVVLRQRTLHSEIEHMSAAEETKFKRAGGSLSVSKTKKHRRSDDRNDSDAVDTDNTNENKDSGNLTREEDDTEDESVDEFKELTSRHHLPKRSIPLVPPSVVPILRNDITNKFWSMVEPYCTDISAEDIKFLEDLIRSYDLYEKDDFKSIPPLGTHYSLRWAQKDSKDEKEASSWSKSENDVDEGKDTKEIDPISAKNYVPGPMVQRLVSALVEEHVPSSSGSVTKRSRPDKESNENVGPSIVKKSKDLSTNGFISTNGDYSELDQNYRKLPFYHSSQCFEKKVRKELEAIGFLDPMNETNQEDIDEVFSELKRCHEELESVATKNKKILQHLLQIAKTEFKRKQIKDQLKIVNSELADVNMKNMSLKLKKKHLSKKEAEDAWKLLKERELLLLKLEETS